MADKRPQWGPSHQTSRLREVKWWQWALFLVLLAGLDDPHALIRRLVLLACVGVVLWRLIRWIDRRDKAADAHEAAASATASRAGGLVAGVRLGVDDAGRERRSRPEQAVLVIGPPRSGKTSQVIIPTLVSYQGPVVSTSTKPDVLHATMLARSGMGRVWQFDPTGRAQPIAGVERLRWSPLISASEWDGALLVSRAMVEVTGVGAGVTDGGHWAKRAQALLAGILHAAALGGESMRTVVSWVSTHDAETALSRLREHEGTPLAIDVLTGVANTEAREQSAIFSTAADALDAYTSQAALDAAEDPNFYAGRFVRSNDTVYIHAPAEHQRLVAPLVCGLLAEIRRATYQAHAAGVLNGRVLFALDEVANIAPIEELPQLASEGGGQGLLLLAVLQDLSQARARWSTLADGFLTLFGSKLILTGVADPRTLEAVSVALGEYDRQMVAETRTRVPNQAGLHRGYTTSTQRQRVLSPGEIANLPAGKVLHLDGVRWELLKLTAGR